MSHLICRRLYFRFSCRYQYFATLSAQNGVVSNQSLSSETPKKPIWYYNNKAIRRRKVTQLLKSARSLDVIGETEEVSHAKRLIEVFKSFDFGEQEMQELIYVKPKLLELSKGKLRKRLTNFLLLNLPKDVIKAMVLKCPSILLIDQEKISLQKRLNILQELTLFPRLNQERCLYLIQKTPQILLISDKSNLNSKIKNLKNVGFNDQQIFELIMKHPAVLTYSQDAVKEKVTFVSDTIGARLALFVKFPRVLTASKERLKERYEYLLEEGYMTKGSHLSENKLRALVLTKDTDFVYRVTNTKMKDFRVFQRELKGQNIQQQRDKKTEDG